MKKNHTLIIGYGNRLRGDDGIGPAIAEIVDSWRLPGVKALAIQQLVPELVDELKRGERVLFVDASSEALYGAYTAYIVEPHKSRRSLGHCDTPANLLAMVGDLEKHEPEAWMLEVAPFSFEFGEGLTEIAQDHVQAALDWIRVWLEEPVISCTKSA